MTETTERPSNLPPANDALWDWLEKKGLNQREGAKLLGFPFPTMNHYLHNRRRPGLHRLDHIFNLTGIPMGLWLEPYVGRQKKHRKADSGKRQYLQAGNAHAS